MSEENVPEKPGLENDADSQQPLSGLLEIDPAKFQRQLTIASMSLLLFVLTIYMLERFATMLQHLFIAIFIAYVILPVHKWLVDRRVPSKLAYILILAAVLGILFGVGRAVYGSFAGLADRWESYEASLNRLLQNVNDSLPFTIPQLKGKKVSDLLQIDSYEQIKEPLQQIVGTFLGFFSGMAVVFIYLIFLIAEKFTFRERIKKAFGDQRADHVMQVVGSINQAISRYIAVKTFIGFFCGTLTTLVLIIMKVEFAFLWGLLTFLLNYIPYLGSVVASLFPIAVSLLQYADSALWKVFVVAGLLIAIQQTAGNVIEPRMLGKRLDVSPLLILLSLSFWGMLWGVVGMILSVPLLAIVKIVLDNIKETKPLATLLSNQ